MPGDAPRTLAQVIPPIAGAPVSLVGTTTIVYMNKGGATLTPGNNDARTNRSSIPAQTSQLPAFEGSAAEWDAIMSCVRNGFARWTSPSPTSIPATSALRSIMAPRAQSLE